MQVRVKMCLKSLRRWLVRLGALKVSKTALIVQNVALTQGPQCPHESWTPCMRGPACGCQSPGDKRRQNSFSAK